MVGNERGGLGDAGIVTVLRVRSAGAGAVVVALSPVALVLIMVSIAVLVGVVAPSRVTSGVYQVVLQGEQGMSWLRIPIESLTCARDGRVATCTTPPVAGAPLEVTVTYAELPANARMLTTSTCAASHGGRPVACVSAIGDYGHVSHSVYVTQRLGLSAAEQAQVDSAVPWWRLPDRLARNGAVLAGLLAAIAAAAVYFLGGRCPPWILRRRGRIALGTGLVGLVAVAVGGLIIAPGPALAVQWPVLLHPVTTIAAIGLAGLQYQLCGDQRRWRVRYALGAAVATAIYSMMAILVFLLDSGFID